MSHRAALLDLDGTLLDTAPDIAVAANAMLRELGLPAVDTETIRGFIGQGIGVLVSRCLAAVGREGEGEFRDRAYEVFRREYELANGRTAVAYPGVREGLEAMRRDGLPLACVTNKMARFTGPLLEATGLAAYFDAVVTADEVGKRKPHPESVLAACSALGVAPGAAVMVGDSDNDALAAKAAGCRFLLVPYGYREGREVHEIPCDGIVSTLLEAAEWMAAKK